MYVYYYNLRDYNIVSVHTLYYIYIYYIYIYTYTYTYQYIYIHVCLNVSLVINYSSF